MTKENAQAAASQLRIISVAIIDNADGIFEVVGMWGGAALDRPAGTGYAVRGRRLAERLAQAMRDGKVFRDAEVKVDMNGKTYVSANSNVLGRTANADLRRMGY